MSTAGDHLVKIGRSALDHRRFWDAMHAVDTETLVEIEGRIAAAAIAAFGLDTSSLALDMTNFATFIDSTNTRAPIAQRGKAKQKRSDLRLVGLGLVGLGLVVTAMGASRCCRTPTPATGRMSPSSPP
ncbi:MAG: hypothetical protein ACRDTH_11950 [Pseudonocardiaceae bacterium]